MLHFPSERPRFGIQPQQGVGPDLCIEGHWLQPGPQLQSLPVVPDPGPYVRAGVRGVCNVLALVA